MQAGVSLFQAKNEGSSWPRVVLGSAVAVFGGLGCWVLIQHFRMKKAFRHQERRSLETRKIIKQRINKDKDAYSDSGCTTIEGCVS